MWQCRSAILILAAVYLRTVDLGHNACNFSNKVTKSLKHTPEFRTCGLQVESVAKVKNAEPSQSR